MQQIYRRTPMPKCDINKVALQLSNVAGFSLDLGYFTKSNTPPWVFFTF